ncbi:hypothetical protein K2Z84_31440 [Candidatus Binatia bacterium]|nr:hypothetical protein [Candidatus Binatia bacterium]
MASGLVVGLLLAIICEGFPESAWSWGALHIGLVGPTALQPWLQWKPYKIAARLLLGVGTATWTIGCLTPERTQLGLVAQFAVGLATLITVGKALYWLRERKAVSPCSACPLGAYPTCSWNLPRVFDGAADPSLVEALALAVSSGAVRVARTP